RVFIFARNIIGDAIATLNIDARSANTVSLGVFTENVEANINIITLLPLGYEFDIVEPVNVGFGEVYVVNNGAYNKLIINEDIDSFIQVESEPYIDVFSNTFDMAASIYDTAPELSLTMLNWIERVLRFLPQTINDNQELVPLYLQVSNLKQFFQLSYNNPGFVPGLSHDLYEYTYSGYLNAMAAYEDKYQNYIDRGLILSDRKQIAEFMLQDLQAASDAEYAIIDRSVNQVHQLRESLDLQLENYRGQDLNIVKAQIAFRAGLETYEDRAVIKAVFDVVSAIANGATAIAGSAGGDPSGLIKFVATLPDLGTDLVLLKKRLDKIAKMQSQINDAMAEIDVFARDVQYITTVEDIAKFYNNLQHTVPNLEAANLVWDEFLIDARADFNFLIKVGVGGSVEYLAELERLAAQAKAITATEINLAQELSRQIDLRISSQVNLSSVDRIGELITSIENDSLAANALEDAFYRALNNLKKPMFVAIANYQAAYNYWSLEESTVSAALNKSFEEYARDLAFMREQESASLDRFYPRPQNFLSIIHNINNPDKLLDFIENGVLHFTLDLDAQIFSDFERVRLDEISVIFEGTELPLGQYNIDLLSSGSYQDRRNDDVFSFSATPLLRKVIYNLEDSETSQVRFITSGAIASDYALNYFMPTPFSSWTVKLNNWQNIDLTQVENVKVSFSGNGIPRPH
ncbi:hypothetical protein L4D09_18045, partial [Photobacterium makurazakiensis]|uniref:hypothetical protein n=1 Tax=Photobacterium makurazakiensis TaxID=2910234 RepID=UPI003D0BE7AF